MPNTNHSLNVGDGKASSNFSPPRHAIGKLAKRQHHVKLNVAICSAADAGLEELLQLVSERCADMNLVNFSTALHRLARLAENGGSFPSHDVRLDALLGGARACLFVENGCGKARCLSTTAWAIARMGLYLPDMMQEIAEMALPRLPEFKPYELSILLWSYAKLQINQIALFNAACEHIRPNLNNFGAACLATLVWTLTTAQIPSCSGIVRKAADVFAYQLKHGVQCSDREDVKPVALENMMWGLATLQVHPNRQSLVIIAEAASNALEKFKVHEFTIIMWAFARLGLYHEKLFSQAFLMIQRSPLLRKKIHPQGIANLLWAFARYCEKNESAELDGAVAALVPTCLDLVPHFKPQELGCVLCSFSKLGKSWGEDKSLDQLFIAAAWTGTDQVFLDSVSFPTVVNTLGAYARFMGDQHGKVEPCSMFVMKLICLCVKFESNLSPQSVLAILESLPQDLSPTLQVQEAMVVLSSAVIRKIASFPSSRLCFVASRLGGLIGELLQQNGLMDVVMGHCGYERSLDLGMEQFDCGYERSLDLGMEQFDGTSYFSEEATDLVAAQQCDPFHWHSEEFTDLVASQQYDPFHWHQQCGPAYVQFTSASWLRPELVEVNTTCCGASAEPAIVRMPEPAGLRQAQPVTLAIIEEFSDASGVRGGTATIMFEVISEAAFDTCVVKIECCCNELVYDTLEIALEVGMTIPNTRVLSLAKLQDGEHQIKFTLNTKCGDVQHTSFAFRVTRDQASSSDLSAEELQKGRVDPLDLWRMVKSSAFGSTGSSTCAGGASHAGEVCEEYAESTEDEDST